MAKREFKHYLIRQGWPKLLKSDCDYFNISFVALAKESGLTRHRIMSIAGETVIYKNGKEQRYEELTYLTEAFDRIIKDRMFLKRMRSFDN